MKKMISILIPTYNEEQNVVALHEVLTTLFIDQLSAYEYEIVFIDNKSKDHTRSLLRELCDRDAHVKAIFNRMNFGQFNSPYYGLCQTQGDCTVFMCADFQDPMELIPEMVKKWEEGHQVICGIKTSSKENKILYCLRALYYKTIRKMSDVKMIEQFTGFGLYDKSFIDILKKLDDPIPFLRGVVAEYAPDYYPIPYEQQKRRAGKTHNNWYSLYDAAMLSFTSYTKIGLRLAVFAGSILSAIGFIIALVYLVMKLIYWDRFVAGSAPTLIGVFLFGSVQLFFIGLLGEYIISINTRMMHRPLVIEEERINFEQAKGK